MKSDLKVDLSYLKELVNELETLMSEAETIKSTATSSPLLEKDFSFNRKYLITVCKAMGVSMGISQEGKMLIGDLQTLVNANFATSAKSGSDSLEAMLETYLKPVKTTGNN